MTNEYDDLREAAKYATEEGWPWADYSKPEREDNVAYITACRPKRILELLNEIETARVEEREACAKVADEYFGEKHLRWMGHYIARAIRARNENDKGRAVSDEDSK